MNDEEVLEEELVTPEPVAEDAEPTEGPVVEDAEPSEEPSPTPAATAEVVARPLLTTPFEDYTVTEGLLLGLLVTILVICLVRIVKGAFTWLH